MAVRIILAIACERPNQNRLKVNTDYAGYGDAETFLASRFIVTGGLVPPSSKAALERRNGTYRYQSLGTNLGDHRDSRSADYSWNGTKKLNGAFIW